MAITKNEKYQIYHNHIVKDVPNENLKILITLFIDYAAVNLGAKAEKADVDRIIEFIQGYEFNYLPISIIASGFVRGSLGKLRNDKTSLNPRNIHEWLSDVSLEYQKGIEHNERDDKLSKDYIHFRDLERIPLGKAICWKIDHVSEEDWDDVPLRIVAEMIGLKQMPTLKDFGIINK
jgi:hypothetical protein